jgi:hypothetical protein
MLEVSAILETKLTVKELTVLFDDLIQGHKPDWLSAMKPPLLESTKVILNQALEIEDLVSPKFSTAASGIFALVPKLSFGSDVEGEGIFDMELSPDAIQALLKEYHRRFSDLKTKWTQTFWK